MKKFIAFLAIVLVSCDGTILVSERLSSAQQEHVKQYLETAGHLNEDQRQAMKHGKPFIGMTFDEAGMAMTLVDWHGELDGRIFKAQFQDRAGRRYVIFFDSGTPNRVTLWSAFTDEEVKGLTTFRDVHPYPPIALPLRR